MIVSTPYHFRGALRRVFSLSVAFLLMLSVAEVRAQTSPDGTITGAVSNKATGELLMGASVRVESTGATTTTERGGDFSIAAPAGPQVLVVEYSSLDTQRIPVLVEAGKRLRVDAQMTSTTYAMQKVTVVGFREGSAAAFAKEKQAENPKTVASTDAFGNPAANPGELLARLPGVSLDMGAGEPSGLYIRGLGTTFISLMVDGNAIASSVGTSAARDFNLQQVATGNIESAEVVRAPLPDQPANAIAGYVNLITRRAFDTVGRRDSVALGTRVTDRGYNNTPAHDRADFDWIAVNHLDKYSILGGKDNLGIAFNASRRSVVALTEEDGPIGTLAATNAYIMPTAANGLKSPITRGWGASDTFTNPFVQWNGGLDIDFKLSDETYLYLKSTYNSFTPEGPAGFLRMGALGSTAVSDYTPGSNYDLETHLPTAGSIFRTMAGGVKKQFTSYGSSAGVEQKLFDGTGLLSLDLSFSDAHTWYPGQIIVTSDITGVGWTIDRRGQDPWHPLFYQTAGPSWNDPANYKPTGYTYQYFSSFNQRQGARLDFRKDFNWGPLQYAKVGIRFDNDERQQDINNDAYTYVGPQGLGQYLGASYLQGGGRYGPIPYVNFPFFTKGPNDIISNRSLWTQTASNAYNSAILDLSTDAQMKEVVDAAYLQTGLKFGKVRVTAGVRLEHTDLTTQAYARNTAPSAGTAFDATLSVADNVARANKQFAAGQITQKSDYNNVFPGVHIIYEPAKDWQLRASYNRSIVRPAVASLLPTNQVNTDTLSIVAGNPNLKPYQSDNYEVAIQRYFKSAGMFELSFFDKEIDNYIRTFVSTVGTGPDNGFGGQYAGYTLSTALNTGAARIRGFEISFSQQFTFLPGFWKSFGFYANYSNTQAEGDFGGTFQKGRLENQRPITANAGISYVANGLQLRVLSQYEGKFYRTVSVDGLTDVYADPRFILDFKSQYAFNKHYEVFLDVQNLTNEYTYTQIRGGGYNFYSQKEGTIYSGGIRYNF